MDVVMRSFQRMGKLGTGPFDNMVAQTRVRGDGPRKPHCSHGPRVYIACRLDARVSMLEVVYVRRFIWAVA